MNETETKYIGNDQNHLGDSERRGDDDDDDADDADDDDDDDDDNDEYECDDVYKITLQNSPAHYLRKNQPLKPLENGMYSCPPAPVLRL